MNVVAIGAHPDDCEEFCAGTLAKYARAGHTVTMVSVTDGRVGSTSLPAAEIAAVRRAEAEASAAVIGARLVWMGYEDEMFFEDKAVRLAMLDVLRECRADVVLTHPPRDYCPDHELTSKVVRDVAVMTPIPLIATPHAPYPAVPVVYYFESQYGVGFVPTEYVDITETMETKRQMFGCHRSQAAWMGALTGEPDERFYEALEVQARYRGIQCGTRYAEGFVRADDAIRMPPARLLP